MEKLIVANWKANVTLPRAEQWLAAFSAGYQPVAGLRVVLAAPSIFLIPLRERFNVLPGVSWGAQDVSPFPLGGYTGSVPAAMLAGLVEYALVGHRERRKYFHETVQDAANKVGEALAEEITPILCVDLDTAGPQAATLETGELERLVVAYTPAEAEHLEIARNRASVAKGVAQVAALFPGCPVLYGGGVNKDNAAELLALPQVSGVMAAGGCLDPGAFLELVGNAGS